MTIESIARVCYDANRRVNLENGRDYQLWDECTEQDRAMFIGGVRYIIEHPDCTDEMVHDFWLANRISDGWEKADERDYNTKKHSSIVPFSMLSVLEKCKDTLFRSIVLALAPSVE